MAQQFGDDVRILVLVNGLHNQELLASLSRLVRLKEAEVLLAFVSSPRARSGLELIRRRPGAHHLPPHRERELTEAEIAGAADALSEAEDLARSAGASVETMQLAGEPGRAICGVAVRRNVDLVVVSAGGRDRPPLGPASLGPTARFVTDHSPVAVLLVREPRASEG